MLSQGLAALQTLFDFTGPIMVARMITYLAKTDQTLSEAIFLIFAFILSRIGVIITTAQCMLTTVNFFFKYNLTSNIDIDTKSSCCWDKSIVI